MTSSWTTAVNPAFTKKIYHCVTVNWSSTISNHNMWRGVRRHEPICIVSPHDETVQAARSFCAALFRHQKWCIECKIMIGLYKVYRVAYIYMYIALIFALETKCWVNMFVAFIFRVSLLRRFIISNDQLCLMFLSLRWKKWSNMLIKCFPLL